MSSSPTHLKEGYLDKKGKGQSMFGRRNWKKRYFIVGDGLLEYYESVQESLQGSSPINKLILGRQDTVESTGEASFVIITATRTLHLCASSKQEKEDWIMTIQSQIQDSRFSRRSYSLSTNGVEDVASHKVPH